MTITLDQPEINKSLRTLFNEPGMPGAMSSPWSGSSSSSSSAKPPTAAEPSLDFTIGISQSDCSLDKGIKFIGKDQLTGDKGARLRRHNLAEWREQENIRVDYATEMWHKDLVADMCPGGFLDLERIAEFHEVLDRGMTDKENMMWSGDFVEWARHKFLKYWERAKDRRVYALFQVKAKKKIGVFVPSRFHPEYSQVLGKRFRGLDYIDGQTIDLKWIDRSKKNRSRQVDFTKQIFLTLTYDPGRYTCDEAWARVGKDWNQFISNLKRETGRDNLVWVDVVEAHPGNGANRGYPHIHCSFFGENFLLWGGTWKDYNDMLAGKKHEGKKKVVELWRRGTVDIEKAHGQTVKKPMQYMFKSIKDSSSGETKTDDKGILTQAMLYVTGKRAYSMSENLSQYLRRTQDLSLNDVEGSNWPDKDIVEFLGLLVTTGHPLYHNDEVVKLYEGLGVNAGTGPPIKEELEK